MNVYDFDKTIFYPDCMILFSKYCLRRHPSLLFSYYPKLIKAQIDCLRKKHKSSHIHAILGSLIKYLDEPEKDINAFWKHYERNLSPWYLLQKRPDDLIISGSPEYLLRPMTDKLGVKMIGTIIDEETGVMIGNVRMAKEKAKYIIEQDMPLIENFYSDSLSDTPIALLAEYAFLVTEDANVPIPWPHLNPEVLREVYRKIDM